MATQAIAVVGTVLKRGDGASTEAFTAIGEIRDGNWSGMEAREIDTSHWQSDPYDDTIPGRINPGQLEFEMNWVKTDYAQLKADMEGRENHNWQICLPDTDVTIFSFTGFVKAIPMSFPNDAQVQNSLTIRVVGLPDMSS